MHIHAHDTSFSLQPEETMFEPFRQYCEMSGLSLMIVPRGFNLTPPQMNSEDEEEKENDELTIDSDENEGNHVLVVDRDGIANDDIDLDAWG